MKLLTKHESEENSEKDEKDSSKSRIILEETQRKGKNDDKCQYYGRAKHEDDKSLDSFPNAGCTFKTHSQPM